MTDKLSERRLVENEAIFRYENEKVRAQLDELSRLSKAEGHGPHEYDKNMRIHFYCECSDETCLKRITMTLDRYDEIHKDRKQFLILPGHQVEPIEDIIETRPEYMVVRKRITPPEVPVKLNRSSIDNSQV